MSIQSSINQGIATAALAARLSPRAREVEQTREVNRQAEKYMETKDRLIKKS